MLQIESLVRGRDRAAKHAASKDAARLPLLSPNAGSSVRLDALEGSAVGGLDAGQAAKVGPTRGGATAPRYAIEPRPEQYLG